MNRSQFSISSFWHLKVEKNEKLQQSKTRKKKKKEKMTKTIEYCISIPFDFTFQCLGPKGFFIIIDEKTASHFLTYVLHKVKYSV